MKWSRKDFSMSVKDIDEKKGIVKAYANVYNNVDYDQDISHPGSFLKTVQENRKKIRVLKDHFWDIKLGVPLEMNASDPIGLLTVTQFNMDKQVSHDMFTDIQLELSQGQESDLSIGYEVIKRDPSDRRIIKEYKLHEYSFLTFLGANPLAVVQDAKAFGSLSLDQMVAHFKQATAMYNANYSDQKKQALENALQTFEKAIKALENGEPVNATQDDQAAQLQKWFEKEQQRKSIENYLKS